MSGDPNLLRVSEYQRPSRVMRTLSETVEAISPSPSPSSTISRKLSFSQNSEQQSESLATPLLRKMSLIPTDPVQVPILKKPIYSQEISNNSEENYQPLQYHTEPYR